MDGNSFDKASRAISTWLSRRQLLKGLIGGALGGGAARNASAQGLPIEQDPGTTPVPTEPIYQYPTQPPYTTDNPTPTETPHATDTPTSTPTETPTPEDIPIQENTPAQQQPVDDTRRRIAEICRAAADVLAKDVAEPDAFKNHPHPTAAYGFLDTLNGVALWGTNAEMWDDTMLSNYVGSADSVAFAVRIGADAYYEVLQKQQGFMQDKIDENDPDTCIFRELAKWRDCMEGCDPRDPVCRMTCFWNFTVLNSCRRCLRGF